ncbi:MAG: hypothetical protein ACTSU2_00290, partial [Promethearchaeota archaeon]
MNNNKKNTIDKEKGSLDGANDIPLEVQQENEKKYGKKVDNLISQAENKAMAKEFKEALAFFEEALKIVIEHPWGIMQFRIKDVMDKVNEDYKRYEEELKRKDALERKKSERIKQEEILDKARGRLKEKELSAKEKRLKMLKEKKERETKISNEAYQLLEDGSKALKDKDYETALNNYKKARDLFNEINWKTEGSRVQESINNIEKEYNKYLETLKKTERSREERLQQGEPGIKGGEHEKEDEHGTKDHKLEQLIAKEKERKAIREQEEQAYKYLEDAKKFESLDKFDEAIESLEKAKEIFLKMNWTNEAEKVTIEIMEVKRKSEKFLEDKRKEEEALKEKKRQEEELKRLVEENKKKKLSKEEKAKLEKLKKLEEEKHKKEVSKQAFDLIDEVEKEVSIYKKRVKLGDFSTPCPYERTIEVYKRAQEMLNEIGWTAEASKLNTAINNYKEMIKQDNKLRELEREKQEKKRRREEELNRLVEENKKKELSKEEKAKLEKLKKLEEEKHKKEVSKQAFDLIDEIEKEVSFYKKRVKLGDFSQPCPYEKAIGVYMRAQEML